jgi:hypothetical protein
MEIPPEKLMHSFKKTRLRWKCSCKPRLSTGRELKTPDRCGGSSAFLAAIWILAHEDAESAETGKKVKSALFLVLSISC